MKSFKNKIVACALAFTLVGGAFAINPNVAEAANKPLQIKKVLNLPKDGVTTPNETFTFTFTKVGKNGGKDTTDMPDLGPVTAAFTSGDNEDKDGTAAGKQLIKETGNALNGVTFPEAGQYTYTVTEKEPETAHKTTDMTYSQAEYTVSLFVKKVGDKFEVTEIQIKQTKNDKGEKGTGEKTEYKPGTGDDFAGNNFKFENNYDKKGGNTTTDEGGDDITAADKKGFALKKIITDDTPDANAEFTFKLTVTKPEGSKSNDEIFKYFIAGNEGIVGTVQEGTYGTAFDVQLKHNQRIIFSEVLLGSKVEFDETNPGAYTGSVQSSTFNGTAGTEKSGIIGDQAGGNFAVYQNKTQTATGLLVDNLPFIALVAVAGAGIAFFVKNREEEEALA